MEQHNTLYQAFREKRNIAYSLIPTKTGEDTVDYHLRLARELAPHKRTNDAEDVAFDRARTAGRELLAHSLGEGVIEANRKAFADAGWAQLGNCYVFTAPQDALNWKVMKNNSDVAFDSWSAVAMTNEAAGDIHVKFLAMCRAVREGLSRAEDPFPSDTFDKIFAQIAA